MKKRNVYLTALSVLMILLSLVFSSCGEEPEESTVCEHVDIDGDLKCEFCGDEIQ